LVKTPRFVISRMVKLVPTPARYATCQVEPGRSTANVRRSAHIDIPTAITPTVTSAIQVSSLLFSANQSAIDE
jgi:hypothetical protein